MNTSTSMDHSRPVTPLGVLALIAALIVTACAAQTTIPSPSNVPQAAGASANGGPDDIASLHSRLDGSSVTIATSAFPNSSLTGAFKTVELLEQDFGVQVEFRSMDGDPLVAALIAGQVQIGQLSLAGAASALSAGANLVAFAGDDQKNTFIVLGKTPVDALEDLRGQPFGSTQNLNQLPGQTGRICLSNAGLDIEQDVQLIKLANTGEVTQAVANGQVAGGISATWRLTRLRLEEGEGIYNILCRGWEVNPQLNSVWIADRAWLEQHDGLALALTISSINAARWARENEDQWVELASSAVENLTLEAARADYQHLVVELDNWPVNGSLDSSLCETTLAVSFKYEAIDSELACDEVATFQYQERALDVLGRR